MQVENFAAAWLLFYVAAHMMDKVEDQDVPAGPWSQGGPGVSINIASGLYFTASWLLNGLYEQAGSLTFASDVNEAFYRSFLVMCGGQQRDLVQPAPTLSQYWGNASDKSGVFFSMACRLGARFGTTDQALLDSYADFGKDIGILIQVLDDLEDFQESGMGFSEVTFQVLRRSLPVIYALEVLPGQEAAQLIEELQQAEQAEMARAAYERIENSGASFYIITEMERLRGRARSSLERAHPNQPAEARLMGLLEELTYQF